MGMETSMRREKINKYFIIGSFIVTVFILIAIFAPILAPYNPHDLFQPYLSPSSDHLLGTNDLGNDILSELIYGTRTSISIGVFTAFIVTFVGTSLGLIAGYFGNKVDKTITAFTNIVMGIPYLPLAMLLIAFMKPGKLNLIIAISITGWTYTCRIIRAKTKELVVLPYIKIEKSLGLNNFVIIYKHLLPNLIDIVMTRGALSVASAMMTESGLSFLGLGSFGEKSWGSILRYAFYRNAIMKNQYWWYVPPIICTSLVVLGFILMGYYGEKND